MDAAKLKRARLLIVDDQEPNIVLLKGMLEQAGYTNLTATTDSAQVASLCDRIDPDLLLLDLHMPGQDGFAVLSSLPATETRWMPILVLTADDSQEVRERALAAGGKDFVTKPFNRTEVLLRIKNLLEVRFLNLEVRSRSDALEQRVRERTEDLNVARLEMLERLALAAEYRDDDTGEHTRRVGDTSAAIARALGLEDDLVDLIRQAASLHDIGKIGISDLVLLKPGKLTSEERALMQTHVAIGAAILSGSQYPLLQMAQQIARTHHERWDGSGYLQGLAGTAIPVAGRIVAVADVFDALTHARPYKEAWEVQRAVAEIHDLGGRQFDPHVVEAFATLDHEALVSGAGSRPAERLPSLVAVS
jgi:putative two-component system response regulator